MLLKNTSRYDEAEIRELLAYAADGFDLRGVAVHVKNSGRAAYAGMAYERVPRIANAAPSASRLVTLRIGAPERFPADNMRIVTRWISDDTPAPEDQNSPEYKAYWRERRAAGRTVAGVFQWKAQRLVTERHPYGGKGSPLIEMRDWREGLVALAAHEFCHVHQFQNNLPRSEVQCERSAAKRLAAYRAAGVGNCARKPSPHDRPYRPLARRP